MEPQEKEPDGQEIWRLLVDIQTRFNEFDRRLQRLEERLNEDDNRGNETFRERNRLSGESKWSTEKILDELIGRDARFREERLVPSLEWLFQEWGIRVNKTFQNFRRHGRLRMDDDAFEIDLLATNGEYAVLIVTRTALDTEDVQEHLQRMEKFRRFFPEFSDRKAVGAVAGIVIEDDADRFACKNGLFVIAQSGETVKLLNDEKFSPKVW